LGSIAVVNAPMLFAGIWSIIKGWLDEKTRNKVNILGANYLPALEKYCNLD